MPPKPKHVSIDEWMQKYDQIVFVKSGTFPWWPGCVVDPHQLFESADVVKQAIANIQKKYTVRYYGDNTIGFIAPSSMRPYNDVTRAEYEKQKISKALESMFPQALLSADEELQLPPEQRVLWSKLVGADIMHEQNRKQQSNKDGEESSDMESSRDKDSADDEERAVLEETFSSDDEDHSIGSEEFAYKKKKKPRKLVKRPSTEPPSKKPRIDSSEGSVDGMASKQVAKPRGKAKLQQLASDDDEPDGNAKPSKPLSKPTKPKTAERMVSSASTVFDDESKEQRIIRLMKILLATTEKDSFDLNRAIKTLDKIDQTSVTLEELRSTGIGKAVAKLAKKHLVPAIRDAADRILSKWKVLADPKNGHASAAVQLSNGEAVIGIPLSQTAWACIPLMLDKLIVHIEPLPAAPLATLPTPPQPSAQSSSQPASDALDITLVPAAVQQNIVRLRAVKLLFETTHSASASVAMEHAVYCAFADWPVYYESISRFFALFKVKDRAEVRELLQQSLRPENVNAFLSATFELYSPLPQPLPL